MNWRLVIETLVTTVRPSRKLVMCPAARTLAFMLLSLEATIAIIHNSIQSLEQCGDELHSEWPDGEG